MKDERITITIRPAGFAHYKKYVDEMNELLAEIKNISGRGGSEIKLKALVKGLRMLLGELK